MEKLWAILWRLSSISREMDFIFWLLIISLEKHDLAKDKKQINVQNWANFKEKHPTTFAGMYEFLVRKIKIWLIQDKKYIDFVEKTIYLRVLHREGENVHVKPTWNRTIKTVVISASYFSRENYMKPYKSSYHWGVDVSTTPIQ